MISHHNIDGSAKTKDINHTRHYILVNICQCKFKYYKTYDPCKSHKYSLENSFVALLALQNTEQLLLMVAD